jgi:hypothetical protein
MILKRDGPRACGLHAPAAHSGHSLTTWPAQAHVASTPMRWAGALCVIHPHPWNNVILALGYRPRKAEYEDCGFRAMRADSDSDAALRIRGPSHLVSGESSPCGGDQRPLRGRHANQAGPGLRITRPMQCQGKLPVIIAIRVTFLCSSPPPRHIPRPAPTSLWPQRVPMLSSELRRPRFAACMM